MEFWGVEIKPGSPLKVEPEDGYVIHASQISLGESKKGATENVPIFVKVGHHEKLVIGTLSQKFPQVSLDLFFEQEFELSHNWTNGSIFVLGYKTPDVMDGHDEEIDSDCESDEEGLPMNFLKSISGPNGLSLTKDEVAKLKALSKDGEADDAESDDDEDESDGDEMGSDESDDEEEETPKKVELPSKKRPNGEAVKNTVASKKAKTAAPQKSSGGKKNGKSKCPFPCGPSCKN